jgi:hypothetical protein
MAQYLRMQRSAVVSVSGPRSAKLSRPPDVGLTGNATHL